MQDSFSIVNPPATRTTPLYHYFTHIVDKKTSDLDAHFFVLSFHQYYSLFSPFSSRALLLAPPPPYSIQVLLWGEGVTAVVHWFLVMHWAQSVERNLRLQCWGRGSPHRTSVSYQNCGSVPPDEVIALRRIQTHSFCTAFIVILLKIVEGAKYKAHNPTWGELTCR